MIVNLVRKWNKNKMEIKTENSKTDVSINKYKLLFVLPIAQLSLYYVYMRVKI